MAMHIFKVGSKIFSDPSLLLHKIRREKYINEVCSYLKIDRKKFFDMVKESEKLTGNFYNSEQAICYIPRLVNYNRVQHDRDKSWIQLIKIINGYNFPAVLEYGCGTGCITQYLQEKKCNFSSYAYDTSSKTLDFAKWRLKNTIFLDEISETDLFTVVICMSVLEHLPIEKCWEKARLLEKITKKCLIVNFVTGSGIGHIDETQKFLSEIEKFFDNHFERKANLWSQDLFAYER